MDARGERVARNESLFREANERLADLAEARGDARFEVLCECADIDCAERIELSLAEYEHVRLDAARFVLRPGHAFTGVEEVLEEVPGRYVTVRKRGEAALVAEDLDPRE